MVIRVREKLGRLGEKATCVPDRWRTGLGDVSVWTNGKVGQARVVVIAFWDFEVVVMSYLGPGMVVIAFLDFEVVVMSYCPDEMVVIAFPHCLTTPLVTLSSWPIY